jgi:hypothetical protein
LFQKPFYPFSLGRRKPPGILHLSRSRKLPLFICDQVNDAAWRQEVSGKKSMCLQFPIATSQQRRTYIFRRVAAIVLAAALVFSIASVRAADKGKWIGTWAASPQPVWNADFLAPINFPRNLWNQTIRQIARVSIGGSQVRLELSNEYGSQPLVIGAAHIALSDGGAAIKAGSDRC